MTMPGFTAAASHLETGGHYHTPSMPSAPRSTVQPQLDAKDQYDDPGDPGSPPADVDLAKDFFASAREQWLKGLGFGVDPNSQLNPVDWGLHPWGSASCRYCLRECDRAYQALKDACTKTNNVDCLVEASTDYGTCVVLCGPVCGEI